MLYTRRTVADTAVGTEYSRFVLADEEAGATVADSIVYVAAMAAAPGVHRAVAIVTAKVIAPLVATVLESMIGAVLEASVTVTAAALPLLHLPVLVPMAKIDHLMVASVLPLFLTER